MEIVCFALSTKKSRVKSVVGLGFIFFLMFSLKGGFPRLFQFEDVTTQLEQNLSESQEKTQDSESMEQELRALTASKEKEEVLEERIRKDEEEIAGLHNDKEQLMIQRSAVVKSSEETEKHCRNQILERVQYFNLLLEVIILVCRVLS